MHKKCRVFTVHHCFSENSKKNPSMSCAYSKMWYFWYLIQFWQTHCRISFPNTPHHYAFAFNKKSFQLEPMRMSSCISSLSFYSCRNFPLTFFICRFSVVLFSDWLQTALLCNICRDISELRLLTKTKLRHANL